ncbi:DUF4351 domain-containing protein, partial [Dolichospermum sp. ST_con]|nr:DUF4351 domain-containing protein [Dolichospermum sp. ST_con]
TNIINLYYQSLGGEEMQVINVCQKTWGDGPYGREEGREEGLEQATVNLVIRLLTKRFGELSGEIRTTISALPLPVLEDLSEALLDFTNLADLQVWLTALQD